MGAVVDHLHEDLEVTVLRDFRDARGQTHKAGERGVIRRIRYDQLAQEVIIEWERDGVSGRETMTFAAATRMRDYFEAGADRFPSARWKPKIPGFDMTAPDPGVPPEPPVVPLPQPHFVRELEAGAANVWALAAQRRFAEAQAQVSAILEGQRELAPSLAGLIGAAAEKHAWERDSDVYDWLKDKCTSLWYYWGACATSGGEGAARADEIHGAEARFDELDKWRLPWRAALK
jgi:hypothetical protein